MMQTPVQITARGFALHSWWRTKIQRKADKLMEFCGWITHCRVVAEYRHKHSRRDRLYNVRIDIAIPRRVLVINRSQTIGLGLAVLALVFVTLGRG